MLDPRAKLFHMAHPDATSSQIRFSVEAPPGPFTEVLTWSFPDVRATGATLAMSWVDTHVALEVEVSPSLVVELPSADAAPYLGRYTFEPITKEDTAKKKPDQLIVSYENGILKGQFDPNVSFMNKFALIRIGPDSFAQGLYEKGVIYDVLRPDLILEFTRTGGRAMAVEMHDDADKLLGRATRP